MTAATEPTVEIRPPRPDELDGFFAHHDRIYGRPPEPRLADAWRAAFDYERSLIARRNGRLVAVAGGCAARFRTPGGSLPTVVLSYLTVDQSERRRGLSVDLLRRQYEEAIERGESIATFVTSHGYPYSRIGAGVIAWSTSVELRNAHAQLIPPTTGAAEGIEVVAEPWSDAHCDQLTDIYTRATIARAGTLELPPDWWRAYRTELGLRPDAQFVLFATRAGEPCGYAMYSVDESWPDGIPSNLVKVSELHAVDAATWRALWENVLTIDLAATTLVDNLAIDDPVRWLLREPRELRTRSVRDVLWARVLDLPAVLAGRRYRGSGSVVLEVTDRFMPRNAGRWRLEVVDGVGLATPVDEPAAVSLGIAELASLFTGAATVAALRNAGRLTVHHLDAAEPLATLLGVDEAPWSAVVV